MGKVVRGRFQLTPPEEWASLTPEEIGALFLTLEDETGKSDIVVWQRTQQHFRQALMTGQLLLVTGIVETKDNVIHVIAGALYDYSHELGAPRLPSRNFR